jgi:hypothetical protein
MSGVVQNGDSRRRDPVGDSWKEAGGGEVLLETLGGDAKMKISGERLN